MELSDKRNIKIRKSNFELMRIVSMLLIVGYHFAYNTNLLASTSGFIHFVILAFIYFTLIHVNSFIILMGYFQCEKNFKFSRLISMNNEGWFYKILFLIIFIAIGIRVETLEALQLISPITLFKQYWFLSVYLLLYCSTAFLGKIGRVCRKKLSPLDKLEKSGMIRIWLAKANCKYRKLYFRLAFSFDYKLAQAN